MCLQLAGHSQHHPLAWNVSWVGDNLFGFLLSHYKPQWGPAPFGCPVHICKADSELEITKSHFWEILFTSLLLWLGRWCLSYGVFLQFEIFFSACKKKANNLKMKWKDERMNSRGDSSAAGCTMNSESLNIETHAQVTVRPAGALKSDTHVWLIFNIPKLGHFHARTLQEFKVSSGILFTSLWENLSTLRPSWDTKSLRPDWWNHLKDQHLFITTYILNKAHCINGL